MNRRGFVECALGAVPAGCTTPGLPADTPERSADPAAARTRVPTRQVKLFLCGDVMTGRGIDQILPNPSDPRLYEPYVRSAQRYVSLAEARTGPLARPADFGYVWGDALAIIEREAPDARIVNLETAVTTSDDAWPGKEIHYRMHPANVPCLAAARVDCCTLANNHVLDWGFRGLAETLTTLRGAGIRTAGAGNDDAEAAAPAIVDVANGSRVLVLAFATTSAGVPRNWAATRDRAGVNLLDALSEPNLAAIARRVGAIKRAGDLVVASIHWGANWGYDVEPGQRQFAHGLIDRAGIDVVVGHSSHHPVGIEVYRDHLILYGCGDFLNDYEGISGYETFRSDVTAAYFASLDASTGRLVRLALTPMQIRHLRLNRATAADARWLEQTLTREGRALGTRVEPEADTLLLLWDRS